MRKELIILKNYKNIDNIKDDIQKCGSIYVYADKYTISNIRAALISLNFTTRLIVAHINNENIFYIYGKRKGGKGVFNEHCKNTVFNFNSLEEFYQKIINTSSNPENQILSDIKIDTDRNLIEV